ncbi:hypothetical protein IFM89_038510 [Coptis chinensis]|uniref:Uncharacterized protein n=1 Tax=Coptis chinensis TaxID=261450 RepID=A0A835IJK1_9MAGN|nr:hypothetical protein IFM89_038510 [Coptis chinensis]
MLALASGRAKHTWSLEVRVATEAALSAGPRPRKSRKTPFFSTKEKCVNYQRRLRFDVVVPSHPLGWAPRSQINPQLRLEFFTHTFGGAIETGCTEGSSTNHALDINLQPSNENGKNLCLEKSVPAECSVTLETPLSGSTVPVVYEGSTSSCWKFGNAVANGTS